MRTGVGLCAKLALGNIAMHNAAIYDHMTLTLAVFFIKLPI
jgi:hypothetical protein